MDVYVERSKRPRFSSNEGMPVAERSILNLNRKSRFCVKRDKWKYSFCYMTKKTASSDQGHNPREEAVTDSLGKTFYLLIDIFLETVLLPAVRLTK